MNFVFLWIMLYLDQNAFGNRRNGDLIYYVIPNNYCKIAYSSVVHLKGVQRSSGCVMGGGYRL